MSGLEPAVLWLAGICAALLGTWGFVEKVYSKVHAPIENMEKRIKELEAKVGSNNDKLSSDHEALAKQEKINTLILRSCSLLMRHCADNNHTGQLQRQADAVDEFMLEESGSF